jgi:hypothetical protein
MLRYAASSLCPRLKPLWTGQPLAYPTVQKSRAAAHHAARSRFLPDDIMTLFTRTGASMPIAAGDILAPQAPVRIDIGAQLRGMWS